MSRPLRFGVNLFSPTDAAGWAGTSARAEQLGYDVVLVPDHLGAPAPFPALAAAAAATERVRLGTFVLNAAFYNPAVLARDVAAIDQLSAGRFEFGIGTGYVKDEFAAAGIPYGTGRQRVDHLASVVERVRAILADPGHRPAAVQQPVPLFLGGNGDRMLGLAAREADVVGFTGAATDRDGALSLLPAETLAERVAHVEREAGERFADIELNVLVQVVQVTDQPRADAARAVVEQMGLPLDAEQLLELPVVLIGTAEQIAADVLAHRDRFGFTYWTVLEPAMEALAPVIELLRTG